MPGVLAHARGRCAATAPCQGHTTYVLGSLAAGGGLQSLRTCDLLCMQPASPSMPVRADKLACAAFAVCTDPAQGEKFFDTLDDVAMDGVILLDGMAIWGPPKSVGLTSLKLWLAGWLQQYDVNVAIMATVVTPNSNKVCRACQEASILGASRHVHSVSWTDALAASVQTPACAFPSILQASRLKRGAELCCQGGIGRSSNYLVLIMLPVPAVCMTCRCLCASRCC
jgi:hypothetical protein